MLCHHIGTGYLSHGRYSGLIGPGYVVPEAVGTAKQWGQFVKRAKNFDFNIQHQILIWFWSLFVGDGRMENGSRCRESWHSVLWVSSKWLMWTASIMQMQLLRSPSCCSAIPESLGEYEMSYSAMLCSVRSPSVQGSAWPLFLHWEFDMDPTIGCNPEKVKDIEING